MASQAIGLGTISVLREPESETDVELGRIHSAAAGDQRAFEQIYRSHVGRIHALCLRMCRDRFEAEECTQEAFVQAWRKLHLFRGDSEFGTWLHRVAVNTVLGRMRKSKKDRDRLTFLDDVAEDTHVPDASAGTRDVESALSTLPGGARSVVVLCGIYGYTHSEASAMLGIAIGTCKAQLHRGRRLLADTLTASR